MESALPHYLCSACRLGPRLSSASGKHPASRTVDHQSSVPNDRFVTARRAGSNRADYLRAFRAGLSCRFLMPGGPSDSRQLLRSPESAGMVSVIWRAWIRGRSGWISVERSSMKVKKSMKRVHRSEYNPLLTPPHTTLFSLSLSLPLSLSLSLSISFSLSFSYSHPVSPPSHPFLHFTTAPSSHHITSGQVPLSSTLRKIGNEFTDPRTGSHAARQARRRTAGGPAWDTG